MKIYGATTELTPNFRLSEFLHPGSPLPDALIIDNLQRLADRLQALRDVLGYPITINSGYRTVAHNKEVGGQPNSYHLKGMAADIVVAGLAPAKVQDLLKHWSGGLGSYSTFTHVDIGPKRRWHG